jgi:nicotinate-nucleotide adenylyltransferase
MRVALYGGSFNPPHLGHALVTTWLACQSDLDQVWVSPTRGHAFGKELAPFAVRVAMLEQALGHLAPRMRIETVEVDLPTPSYTIDTVDALYRRDPGLRIVLVIGTDVWAERARWHRFDDLLKKVEVLVLGRGTGPDPEGVTPPIRTPDLSSTEVRRRLAAGDEVRHLVAAGVLALIRQHGLYGVAPGNAS